MKAFLAPPTATLTRVMNLGIMVSDAALSEEVRCAVQAFPVHIAFEMQNAMRYELLECVQAFRPDILILELGPSLHAAESLIQEVRQARPECRVIALGKASNAELILQAVRAGCADYVCPPVIDSLPAAILRISEKLNEDDDRSSKAGGKVLAFVSAKGGSGATTLACHLAAEIRRSVSEHTLLLDADDTAGVVGFMMRAKRNYTILDVARNIHRLDRSLWSGLVSQCSGLDVLPAPAVGSFEPLPAAETLRDTMCFLRSQYEYVIADLGRGLTALPDYLLGQADRVFMVLTPEQHAVEQAKRLAHYLSEEHTPQIEATFVLNRVSRKSPMAPGMARELAALPVCFEISSDYRELYDACLAGKLVPPSKQLGKEFVLAARTVLGLPVDDQPRHAFGWQTAWQNASGLSLK